MKSTNKYILKNFGNIDEELIEEYEEYEENHGRHTPNVKRVNFPTYVIIPDGFNVKDRKSVYNWALLISEELLKSNE